MALLTGKVSGCHVKVNSDVDRAEALGKLSGECGACDGSDASNN